jgi:hypothetical protein
MLKISFYKNSIDPNRPSGQQQFLKKFVTLYALHLSTAPVCQSTFTLAHIAQSVGLQKSEEGSAVG